VPIAAAVIVLLMLLWYALAHDPKSAASESGTNLGAAARADGGDGTGAAADGSGGGDAATVVVASPGPSGCQTGKTLPAGVSTETVTVGSTKRSYLLAVPTPAAAGATQPRPVILNFHGDGQGPTDLEAYTGLAGEAIKRGYVIVDPAGVDRRWNFVRSNAVGPDDVAFVAALLNDLHGRGCIADNRVFATGFGDGADMAVTASCALPGRIAAVVSVAGGTVPASCPKTITNLFEIHGAADQIAPWEGGGTPRAAPFTGVTAQPVPDRLGRYAQAAGCSAAAKTENLPGLGQLTAWNCDGKPDVGALSVAGGGHTWPQAQPRPELGPTAMSFSATVVSLLYFQAHPVVGSVVSADSPGIADSLGKALAGAG
jgi:polyhydroxybutyrate depolymerase